MQQYRSWSFILIVFFLLLVSVSCSSTPEEKVEKATEETLERAFEALKQNNWNEFSRLLITTADYDMKTQGISRFKAKKSFTGGVLKPQLIDEQKKRFERIVDSDAGGIDLAGAEFESIGTQIDSGEVETLQAGTVAYKTYSLKLSKNGKEYDTKGDGPWFVVAEFNGWYKILSIGAAHLD